MNRRIRLICAWAGPAGIVGALIGWLIAGVLPVPPAASLTADQIVDFYTVNPTATRTGLLIAILALSGIGALVAVIAITMLSMEGRNPILSFLQLVAGAVTWVLLIVPLVIMQVATFRPDRAPELTLMLNDLAWILFIPPVGPFVVQNVAIGAAILLDRSAVPVLPRWIGYLNLWVAFLFLPGTLSYFFTGGPFAWQGIFSFWLALSAYALWAFVMGFSIRAAIKREPVDALVEETV